MDEVYLTKEGYKKLFGELEQLKNVKRRQISKAIGEAIAHGDISENAEYDAAKDAQGHNEIKIRELEDKLARSRILDDTNMPTDEVLIGARVKIQDMDTDEVLEYILVSEAEADYDLGKISILSPVGKGLMNHKENETVEIAIPAGTLKYKILKISR